MTTAQHQLAAEIRELAAKLTDDGWDRLRGLRLAQAAKRAIEECNRVNWLEAISRASELAALFDELFDQEAASEIRLKPVLQSAAVLASLLDAGQHAAYMEQSFLPARPEEWLFVLAGNVFDSNAGLTGNLATLGFSVTRAESVDEAAEACLTDQVILLADASWLDENAERMAAILLPASPRVPVGRMGVEGDLSNQISPTPSFPKRGTERILPASLLLVAIADTNDFPTQVKARQLGARLLLDSPPNATRLITQLAGLAWMPRSAYRVMIVDDDSAVMSLHAGILQAAGFEVLTIDDPVAARDFLGGFAPEVCVLNVEMPACRGIDLAALLRRDKRYSRLPVIYLSAFSDVDLQLDARHAGGEDYLVKPVDTRLLVTAVMARAQQFRMLETADDQRRQASKQLDNLRAAVDAHAIVSITDVDGTITSVNRKFCEISGYSREELIGQNHRIVKSGHHPAVFFERMWKTISTGRTWQDEVQNRRKDGNPYWVKSTITPILNERGLPEQYISIRTDVSAQKRIQAKRRHQSRLLDLLRQALHQYLANHDLDAVSALLLNGILKLTDSAYGFLGEVRHDPDGLPYLKTHALTNVAWNKTTRNLYVEKHLTGMESGKLNSLIDTVLRTGKVVSANDSDDGHPQEDFIAVPIRYGEALIGIVGLSNRPDGYGTSSIADFLQSFTDTYANILEAERQRYFQQQVILDLQRARDDAERTNRDESAFLTGWEQEFRTPLNAMLAHSQILQMNDTAESETRHQLAEIAKGGEQLTQLIRDLLDLLDTKGAPRTGQETKAPVVAEAQRRILVAEDNPANQAVLRMQLSVLGFAADIADNGAAAMLKWQAGGHDLILADRNMPVMDGLELTRAIRATERENGGYVPIIAITAAQQPEELSLCRQAGMDDVLPKPIELDALQTMLERWLPHAAPLASNIAVAGQTGENKSILDTGYLARIIGNADAKQTRELIDLFTTTARNDLPTCKWHLAKRNGRMLSLAMHKLKSSARMVGALGFAHLAENLEDAAKAGQLEAATTLLAELEYALNDVETAVSRLGISATPTIIDADAPIAAEMLPSRVLIVDDDPVARHQITMLLSSLGVQNVLTVAGAEAALAEIAETSIDLLISDLNMPGMDGVEFMRHLAGNNYRGCMILASGVEEQLLQTAAEMTRAKGMNLRGTIKKPVTRNALLQLLTLPCDATAVPAAQREKVAVTPADIQEGIRLNEFEVHFQPKVDAATLRVVGMESLARWQHKGKTISPDIFITMAEQHGLIGPLSEVLVTKALIGGARLATAGYPLTIAVNLSANWLSDIRLPEFILASVQATGFKAENLILEITETGVMADMATALDVMTRLRLKGFKLSIDDFGTGYSSMEQLQRIPFGELKLDKSFVQGATEKTAARAILASTLAMAQKLKLSTVAEGVESQAELDLVRGLGCNLVQGWFVAKAMPVDQLLVWLKERGA
jgi:PAS domain S-box-containing protein